MTAPQRPPEGGPYEPFGPLTALVKTADRIEKFVRMYRVLTYLNMAVFGLNAVAQFAYIFMRYYYGY